LIRTYVLKSRYVTSAETTTMKLTLTPPNETQQQQQAIQAMKRGSRRRQTR